jgi:hypothetical protein
VGLLIVARKYEEAIDMCYAQKITLTDEMAEKMTIAKAEEDGDDEYRNKILEKIGDCCVAQVWISFYELITLLNCCVRNRGPWPPRSTRRPATASRP